jgi:hypothetical protein
MCGRVRLPTDYSEIKIRLRFDETAPAPNFAPSWNTPPTGDILVATYTLRSLAPLSLVLRPVSVHPLAGR